MPRPRECKSPFELAAEQQMVILRKDPVTWRRLSPSLRARLHQSVARIGAIRASIAEESPIEAMPPVKIFDELWMSEDGTASVDGCTSIVNVGKEHYFGAHLPAQTALSDDGTVRRILVHEYTHVFDLVTRVVDAADRGAKGALEFMANPYDHDDEHNHLADPHDWFGDEDAANLVHWNDPAIAAAVHLSLMSLRTEMPIRVGGGQYKTPNVSFPLDVMDRVRALRALKGGT